MSSHHKRPESRQSRLISAATQGGRFTRLCVLVLSTACIRPAFAADALDNILAGLAQHPHGQVKFSEETTGRMLARPLHAEGVLRFDAPDRLEKQTLSPIAEDMIVEGEIVTIARKHHRSSVRLSDYPKLSPLLEGIRATLSGNRAALEQHFRVEFTHVTNGWSLRLLPLAPATDAGIVHIDLHGHEDLLESVIVAQRNGDQTVLSLSPLPPG